MQSNPLITFNLITRDNSDSIIECLDSTLPAKVNDYVICDTGSEDNTIDLIAGWGIRNDKNVRIVEYKKVYGYPWTDYTTYDFGKARQLALAETKTPFMVWLDSDDVLQNAGNLPLIAQQIANTPITQVMFPYKYAQDSKGNDIVSQYRERLIRVLPETKWIEPVHEYISEGQKPVTHFDHTVIWVHKRKVEHVVRTDRRNREILRHQFNSLKKLNQEPHLRLLQNLAFEHYERREFTEATEYYERFFIRYAEISDTSLEKQLHEMQLSANLLNWARAEISLDNLEKGEQILRRMKEYDEFDKDVLVNLAEIRVRQNKFQPALIYLAQAEGVQDKPSILPTNKMDAMLRIPLMYAQIYKALGRLQEAAQYIQQALQISPTEPLRKELSNIIRNIEQKQSFDGYFSLKNELLSIGDWDRLENLINSIPKTLDKQSSIQEDVKAIRDQVKFHKKRLSKKLPEKKDIAFYTGGGYEKWNAESIKDGIGGSEEMVVGLSKGLANLGHKVTVYNDCEGIEGDFDGVSYVDYKKYDKTTQHDVLIVSRLPQMFANQNGEQLDIVQHNSLRQYLWLHDAHYGQLPTASFGLADKILVLSNFQKKLIQEMYNLPEDKFVVTRNGIDIDHYETLKKPKRDNKQVIYCSSYDRGLHQVLLDWKKIKQEVPTAKLKVYYGWDTYVKRMEMMPDNFVDHPSGMTMRQYKEACDRLMVELGVVDGGRIGQDELYLEMAKSNIWFYPTWFSEISCITAMRAQYAGSIPVCTPVAALTETVKEGVMQENDLADEVIRLLKSPDEELRQRVMEAGKDYSLSKLAEEWDGIFNS